ncbi:MAG: class I SAM-dependent methyltransferase [Propionicimonas sp.]|nr:class I SAM-dependent methyltransferase [Propionicimonas sp.]
MRDAKLPAGVVIETRPDLDPGARYDGRAAGYDWLIGRELYNRIAWSTSPRDYEAFARRAVRSASGPLLDVAAGTATATANAYRTSSRPVVVTDRSRDMLARAARRIADGTRVRPGVRFVQVDAFALPFAPGSFDTVACLGFLHLVDDPAGFLDLLTALLKPGGRLFCSSLVAETGRGARYLALLRRAGEVATPRTADELATITARTWRSRGCMAYLEAVR